MAFQKSEYKNQYEEHESELAYEFDRPLHGRNYLDEDDKTKKFTEVYFNLENFKLTRIILVLIRIIYSSIIKMGVSFWLKKLNNLINKWL